MYLVDTHTHLYFEAFDADRSAVLQRAVEAGVAAFCLPGIDLETLPRLRAMCDTYPDRCFPMIGLHPTNVKPGYASTLSLLRQELENAPYIAVGEIGIDLHWDKTYLREQVAAFEEQLRWSIEKDLPVALHVREAFPPVFESLHKIGIDRLRGVFHSFGGTREELEEILSHPQFLLGINGVVTYKNTTLRDYLPLAPLERLILETDAPYLPPVPHRGQRNEPAYVPLIAQKLAEIYGVSVQTVAEITTCNATKVWKLPPLPPAGKP
jgi:TatD DNase family protein